MSRWLNFGPQVHGVGGTSQTYCPQDGKKNPACRIALMLPLPCPQTTPGLAGGRRRRHGQCPVSVG